MRSSRQEIMDKIFNIQEIRFDKEYLFIRIDGKSYRIRIRDISQKLSAATDKERSEYDISPSGYGIHWPAIDEDLSVSGILKAIPHPFVPSV